MTGKFECKCPWAVANKGLCKHVVAVGMKYDLMDLVGNWVKRCDAADPLSFPTIHGGGKKLSARSKRTRHGFTIRKNLTQLPPSQSQLNAVSSDDDHPQSLQLDEYMALRPSTPGKPHVTRIGDSLP